MARPLIHTGGQSDDPIICSDTDISVLNGRRFQIIQKLLQIIFRTGAVDQPVISICLHTGKQCNRKGFVRQVQSSCLMRFKIICILKFQHISKHSPIVHMMPVHQIIAV